MAINCYSGIMGSGKSYEVVSFVIIPAVAHGRRVVTNIAGIDNDGIRAYCCEKLDVPLDKCGAVVSVTNAQVAARDFFPTEESHKEEVCTSLVHPGDLVAVDEAYKIWGGGEKIHKEHQVFFREHRHYVHSETGVACDMVLMTQAIGDLHRILKVVIEQSFVCHKAKGIGRADVYTITMWEGWKQNQKNIVKDWTQCYKPEIFPLYKSYAGESQGKEMATDKRQNILADKRLIYKLAFLLVAGSFSAWRVWHFFSDKINPSGSATAAQSSSPSAGGRPQSDYSADWRVVGTLNVGGVSQVVLAGTNGLRLENAIYFKGAGLSLAGVVDGKKVTRFSGPAPAADGKREGLLR